MESMIAALVRARCATLCACVRAPLIIPLLCLLLLFPGAPVHARRLDLHHRAVRAPPCRVSLRRCAAADALRFRASRSDRGMQVHKMDHLACFVPGMLVLGAQGDVADRYVALAKDLSDTCVQMYAGTATGLAPELVNFRDGRDMFTNDRSAHNLLRPEAVESLFYLYRKTGDEIYREQGWAIFTAFEAHCRLRGGYAGVRDVRVVPPVNDDTQ